LAKSFTLTHTQDLVRVADGHLGLAGELVQYFRRAFPRIAGVVQKLPVFETIPHIAPGQEEDILSRYSRTELWQSYTIESPKAGVKYTILVEYRDNSDAILRDERLKDRLFEYYLQEMSRHFSTGELSDASHMDFALHIGKHVMYSFGIPRRRINEFLEYLVTRSGIKVDETPNKTAGGDA